MNSSFYHKESRHILGHRVTFIYEVVERISSDSQATRYKKLVIATVSGPLINTMISATSMKDAMQQTHALVRGAQVQPPSLHAAWFD